MPPSQSLASKDFNLNPQFAHTYNNRNFYGHSLKSNTKIRNQNHENSSDSENQKNNSPLKTKEYDFSEGGELCPYGKDCPFYQKYLEQKNENESLKYSNKKLDKFTRSLYMSLNKKEKAYQYLIAENNNLKKTLSEITGNKYNNGNRSIINRRNSFNFGYKNNNNFNNFTPLSDRPLLNHNNNFSNNYYEVNANNSNFNNTINGPRNNNKNQDNQLQNNKNNLSKNRIKSFIFRKDFENNNNTTANINNDNCTFHNSQSNFFNTSKSAKKYTNITNKYFLESKTRSSVDNSSPNNNNNTNTSNSNNNNPLSHYEYLSKFTESHKFKISRGGGNYSLLSLNVDLIKIMTQNENISELSTILKTEENFKRIFSNLSPTDERLSKYHDLIDFLVDDYKELIRLNMRMKDFIRGSISLVDSIMDYNLSKKTFVKNICSLLKCDKANLYLFDKISDCLIIIPGSGEEITKSQSKIPKEKGIVGACFMERRRIRIDDAYLDKRFNKEVDKKNNYRTRSILCYPLLISNTSLQNSSPSSEKDKENECFGVIEAINKHPPPFNNDDEELLKLFSRQACTIFMNLLTNDDKNFLIKKLFVIVEFSIDICEINEKKEFTLKTEETLKNLFNSSNATFYFVEKKKKIIHYLSNGEIKRI